jgi:hypothetical protein
MAAFVLAVYKAKCRIVPQLKRRIALIESNRRFLELNVEQQQQPNYLSCNNST